MLGHVLSFVKYCVHAPVAQSVLWFNPYVFSIKLYKYYIGDEYGTKARMPTYGKIGEYEPDSEDRSQYVERLKNFLVANNITAAEKQASNVSSYHWSECIQILRSIVSPVKPNEKTYTDSKKLLSNHYCPKPSEIVQWSKLYYNLIIVPEQLSTAFDLLWVSSHAQAD